MEKLEHQLTKLLDHQVFAFIPMFRRDGVVPITIRAVEAGGVWIENTHVIFGVGQTHNLNRSQGERFEPLEDMPRTVCFLPWGQISYIVVGDELETGRAQPQLLHFQPKDPAGSHQQ